MNMKITGMVLMLALLLAACAPAEQINNDEPQAKVAGTACTMEYTPVCGENGITYGNPCMAEAEGMNHTPGECPQAEDEVNI